MSEPALSPLNNRHLELKGRMVDFAGWHLPVQYVGIQQEAIAVRSTGGVFDISHMGQIFVRSGEKGAVAAALDSILTSSVTSLNPGEGQYSLILNDAGGIIDDLIVYCLDATTCFLVVNASKTEEDYNWLAQHLPKNVSLENASLNFGGIAVQGPDSAEWFASIQQAAGEPNPVPLPERFGILDLPRSAGTFLVCRTGYTGEDGFELFCTSEFLGLWWDAVVDAGATPAGLGARDILRLEKCYPLNGNDLTTERTPMECGLRFAVDMSKPEFTGKSILAEQQIIGVQHRLVAVRQTGKAPPPRTGYPILSGGHSVGLVTSGGVSPSLRCGIALVWVQAGHHTVGTELMMEIRGKQFPCQVVKKPFV
ncbi:MAG: glycine cleavage system aminomethyltransferase GcvT, partial [Fuerstiella sp.]|nr:glycine cleavage system aminomethyltransferase GcvT [Fuerstiella sp.]